MRRILLVDDDKIVRESVNKILIREGYVTELAQNASEALMKIADQEFDLIISDIRMPGKNGVEVASEIRKLFRAKARKEVPIIFITAYAETVDELKAVNFGEVILKPFDISELVMTIREYL